MNDGLQNGAGRTSPKTVQKGIYPMFENYAAANDAQMAVPSSFAAEETAAVLPQQNTGSRTGCR